MVNNKLNAIQRLIKCKFIEIIHKINENILESEKNEKGSSRLYIVSYRIEREAEWPLSYENFGF